MICSWIQWCALQPEAQAAWVQAIGSVIAILVAVTVPTRIAGKERKRLSIERGYRAKSLAFVLLPPLTNLRNHIVTAEYRWKRTPGQYDDDAVAELLQQPSELTERLLDLHVMGAAGAAIQAAIVATSNLRNGVFTQYAYWRYAGMYYDPDTGEEGSLQKPEDVHLLFKEAHTKVEGAIAALESILNS